MFQISIPQHKHSVAFQTIYLMIIDLSYLLLLIALLNLIGEVTVLVTGPLTNIALAAHLNPKFMEQVKEIVLMGGSYLGNTLTY